MFVDFFIKGVIIGLAMTISIGPITIMSIRETIAGGQFRGFIVGLGSTTGDLFYSSVAAFGITVISNFLIIERVWIHIVGAVILFVLGFKTFRAEPSDPKLRNGNGGLFKSYLASSLIALTNPITIFGFLALFATADLARDPNNVHALIIVSGVIAGSILWFLILTTIVRFFRNKFDVDKMRLANKIAGILIFIAGIVAIVTLF